ncbi:MAG: antibiotic biosynthesis monooxygenase family protein [Thermoguttaceae bacterium]
MSPRRVQAALSRRSFLATGIPACAAVLGRQPASGAEPGLPQSAPVRTITQGPKHHWFGYYDKLQFDPSCRYVLGMEVDFEHRQPAPDDAIRIGMVDLARDDRWIELGTSRAWCWQQGCMLQWRPQSRSEILWNDRRQDRLVCHILDVTTGKRRTIPHPIYTLSPDGRWAATCDFRRLADMRPGYGYAGLPDPHQDELAPKDSGIWRVDLDSGAQALIVSLAELARVPFPKGDLAKAKHWFNHLLVNPDGSRLEFLHRWRLPGQQGFLTRMCTVAPDGSELRILDQSGYTSHFIWRDPEHLLAWTRQEPHGNGFYLFEDKPGGAVQIVGKGVMTENGHCSYLPGGQWILNDTYPDRQRHQQVYLYHVATGRKVVLGRFHCPAQYQGPWRCDLHPRLSPDGQSVVIDSPHTGAGRQMHLIDLKGIVA